MKRQDFLPLLDHLDACSNAQAWALTTPGEPEDLWFACLHGNWLIWLARHAHAIDRWTAADLACRILAPLTLEYAGLGEWAQRLREMPAIVDAETAKAARYLCLKARACADADNALCAGSTIAVAIYAADATYAAAADDAAIYAAYAIASDYSRAAMDEARRKIAEIVRERISWADVDRGLSEVKS